MTGKSLDDDHSAPSPRPRPARPAQLSVADFAQNQRERSRQNLHDSTDIPDPGNPSFESANGDDLERSASASRASPTPGRFASLRRKITKSKRSSGFLLDDGRGSRLAPQTINGNATEKPRLGSGDPADVPSTQVTDVRSSFGIDGVSESRIAEQGQKRQQTPDSKRDARLSRLVTPPRSGVDSPQSFESSRMSSDRHQPYVSTNNSRPNSTAIDPAQLVRMALNLSESRRMQLDPGHLPSIAISSGSRQTSSNISAGRSPASQSSRDSVFPDDRRSLPRPATGSRSNQSRQGEALNQGSSPLSSSKNSVTGHANSQPEYLFSPATLERAKAAKKYMELSAEYRRLLRSLPLLAPCSQANGEKKPCNLGRPYNPLQYVRNRKLRHHENIEFDSQADGWDDPVHVQHWVESVESEAQQPGYVADDVVLLPHWSSGKSKPTNPESEEAKTREHNHRKGMKETSSKRFDWTFDPADLLQDAYWLEQDHHKTLISSKHGGKMFPSFSRPLRAMQSRSRAGTGASRDSDSQNSDNVTSPVSHRSGRRRPTVGRSPQSDEEGHKNRHHHHVHGSDIVKRTLFRRRPKAIDSSSDTDSDEDSTSKVKRKASQGQPSANIGPLEKHMQAMIEEESKNERTMEHAQISPPSALNSPEGARRHGISGVSHARSSTDDEHGEGQNDAFGSPLQEQYSAQTTDLPRISVEAYDGHRWREQAEDAGRRAHATTSLPQQPTSKSDGSEKKRRRTRLGFWQRPKSKPENQIRVTDFASTGEEGTFSPSYGSDFDSGVETMSRIPTTASTTDGRLSAESDYGNDTADSGSVNGKPVSPDSKNRLFKGGRIGELVRNESTLASSIVFKRQPPRQKSVDQTLRIGPVANGADESSERRSRSLPKDNSEQRTEPHTDSRRDPSVEESAKEVGSQYHIKNLPTFQSSAQSIHERRQSQSRSPARGISPQQEERRMERIRSRLSSMAPSMIDTSDLTSSSRDLSRYNSRELPSSPDRQHSYGLGSYTGSTSAVRAADRRLSAVLSAGDGQDKENPQPSPSVTSSRADFARSPTAGPHAPWSMRNIREPKRKPQKRVISITAKDLAQVQTLLLSAGVKAQSIARKADMPQDEITNFLREAFVTAGQDPDKLGRMSLRQAHVMAAQLITNHLAATLQEFDASVVRFRSETCQKLTEQIDDLRDKATSVLMPKVQSASGEADAFVARLTTTHTLAIRQVMDNVESMLRKRRRRLRYLQRQLFTLLEWVLVAIMWFIWLTVFVLRIFRGVFTGSLRIVGWLLWF